MVWRKRIFFYSLSFIQKTWLLDGAVGGQQEIAAKRRAGQGVCAVPRGEADQCFVRARRLERVARQRKPRVKNEARGFQADSVWGFT
jgi:hypothetical protein